MEPIGVIPALFSALMTTAAAVPADPRPTVAVLYFDYDGKSEEMKLLRKGLAQMLISDLSAMPEVRIVERERLQAILDELKLNQTTKVDPATANKLGKLLGARFLVMGAYFDLLGNLRADARVVETQTGRIVRSSGATSKPDGFLDLEQHLAKELSATLASLAPTPNPGSSGGKGSPMPPSRLSVKTALRYAAALDAVDRKDNEAARAAVNAALAEQPDFALAAAVERGAKGDPIPKEKVLNLLGSDDGPRSFAHYALVAGVCGYTGQRELKLPCRDARAVRDLLVSQYGYPAQNVMLFIDRPGPGEKTDGVPTASNLRLAVEKFRERFGDRDLSTFLFYYSGHGGYEKGARKDFGVLQPSGYFERTDLPIADRGWDMQDLVDDIRKGVPARHVMIVLDSCYSGWAVGAKGDDHLRPDLMSLWKERAEVVLSAGTKGQRAWEDEEEQGAWTWGGHSAMTAFFLQALTPASPGAAPPADLNGDSVVTDEELAKYLHARVPEAVRAVKRAEQVPQFFRFDQNLPQSGQFLFVPPALASADGPRR
jgi:TolB-like protein